MKIKISYKPDEEKEAAASVVAFLRIHPGAIVRKSDRHDPFRHIYIATEKQRNPPCKNTQNVV
ncbi:MAG: hypothetical protein IJA45_03385 [Oscillospiraceae bacterium]|nr:hypothetical protein [Oscillospiraceae bacterium]